MKAILMPQVGQDIPDAVITQWLKKENDHVEKGEVVLVVESDKASFEIEADCSGVLLRVLHQEGDRVEVFRPLAYIGRPGESQAKPPPQPVQSVAPVTPAATARATQPARETAPASPSARRLAREQGVELSEIQGTGPGGRIIKRDILAAAKGAVEDEVIPFSRMRQVIADRLTLSTQTIPHFHLVVDVDMTDAIRWRQAMNSEHGSRISVSDLVVHAVARALRDFPHLNAHGEANRLVVKKRINIGVAVVVEGGLLVPVIPDADRLTVEQIGESSRKNAEAARRGVIDPRQVGTFTVSSLGMYAIDRFLPIINPPECAILGVGAIKGRVIPIEGGVGVRDMMTLVLACDHRAIDGAYAAGFLNRVRTLVEATGRPIPGTSNTGGCV